jgi:hypothetical protein
VAPAAPLQEERKLASVLFVDLVWSPPSPTAPIRKTSATSSSSTTHGPSSRSNGTKGPSTSSSATPSWPCSTLPRRGRSFSRAMVGSVGCCRQDGDGPGGDRSQERRSGCSRQWASNAIASAVRARRHKDESSSRALLGRVLLAERRAEEAIGEIRTAVAIADELGSPPGRWQSRAALGKALFATGDDDGAAFAYHEAGDIIRSMAATLSLEHGKTFLEALPVQEALKAGS